MRLAVALIALVATTVPVALADRLHLDGGGVVDTEQWWIEGEELYYRSADGTIGLPAALVVRIERNADAEGKPAAAARRPQKPVSEPTKPSVSRQAARIMQQANDALAAGDFENAATLYQSLMRELDADQVEPAVGYALAQIRLGEYDLALSVVLDGLARSPRHSTLLELLGDIRDSEERVEEALRAWRDAFAASPNDRLRDKILKAERELQAGRDYAMQMSSHFNVRFDGEVDSELAEAVTDYLEQQFWSMAERFDLAPRQPITVVLYPQREFRDVTLAPDSVGGLYDGKIRLPIGGLDHFIEAARGLLRHELTHAFVHAKSRGGCPRWLHEGLAQILEGRVATARDRELVVRRLREVDPVRWDEEGFSYPLALSLTEFLRSRSGFEGLVRLLERLGEGDDPDAALVAEYGQDYTAICREWAASALQGGMR